MEQTSISIPEPANNPGSSIEVSTPGPTTPEIVPSQSGRPLD